MEGEGGMDHHQLLVVGQGRGGKGAGRGCVSSQGSGGGGALLLDPVSPQSASPPPLEERAFQQQRSGVHVAQDLLSLKYGEESQVWLHPENCIFTHSSQCTDRL